MICHNFHKNVTINTIMKCTKLSYYCWLNTSQKCDICSFCFINNCKSPWYISFKNNMRINDWYRLIPSIILFPSSIISMFVAWYSFWWWTDRWQSRLLYAFFPGLNISHLQREVLCHFLTVTVAKVHQTTAFPLSFGQESHLYRINNPYCNCRKTFQRMILCLLLCP